MAEQHLDLPALREIFGGDPARVAAHLELFVKYVGPMLASLRAVVDDGDAPALRLVAHRIAGSCGMVTAHRMAELALMLEMKGVAGTVEGAGPLVDQLDEAFEATRAYIGAAAIGG
ncbi:MAG: Hpt domain-containing protein [Gemmatimonadales bacterium]